MKLVVRQRWQHCLLFVVLQFGTLSMAQATASIARASPERAECLGYYTLTLPGEFEYAYALRFDARFSNFADDLGAWGTEVRLALFDQGDSVFSFSQPAGVGEIAAYKEARNQERQREIEDVSERLALTKPTQDGLRSVLQEKLAGLRLYEPVGGQAAIARVEKERLTIHALVNGRVLTADLKPLGTSKETLDALLGHYKPRALGEVPAGPGVCVPHGFFTGEKQPATIGLNIRLKDQPDIVVYLLASDAAGSQPWNPEEYIDRKTEPMSMFYASRGAVAMNRLRPYQRVSIDGREGLGAFVNVKRDAALLQPVHNPVTNNTDWGFLAYIPGKPGGKPGESFNLTFKVERFGRFAKSPMTEKEFRGLTLRIAASIKRRPGAWVSN